MEVYMYLNKYTTQENVQRISTYLIFTMTSSREL